MLQKKMRQANGQTSQFRQLPANLFSNQMESSRPGFQPDTPLNPHQRATSSISNRCAQCLPVTNSLSDSASQAIPFRTASLLPSSVRSDKPVRSTRELMAPVAGSILTMKSVCHTFAQTSPLIYSSSFRLFTGDPCSVTSTERTGEKSSGLKKLKSGGTVAQN